MFVTTSQQELAIISSECKNPTVCDIPSGYNKKNINKISNVQYQTKEVRFFDKLQLYETKLTVNKAKEQVEFWYHKYHRYLQVQAQVFSVIDANQPFISQYNGYMGIAPYSDTQVRKERSFLWQLKNSGVIDNIVVSFWVRPKSGNNSQIKFGSWDESATAGPLNMYKTVSPYSWAINADKILLGATEIISELRYVELDPMYPYLYIPDADFEVFAK